jgi:hypothetical protein
MKQSIQRIVSLLHKEKSTKRSYVTTVNQAIVECLELLHSEGTTYQSEKWQAVKSPDSLFEVIDVHFRAHMPETVEELARLTQADLPWSEDHFQERVAGVPANPGYEYQNWPYYKPEKHNSSFRAEGQGYFSHTYMERFWPDTSILGTGIMKYRYGDFNDILGRLKRDPYTRQAYFAIWHPNDQANLETEVRLPCTIGYQFLIRDGKINILYTIRSCDILRHFKNDIYMTVRLAHYVRDYLIKEGVVPSLKMGTIGMYIGSLHCFNIEKSLLASRIKQFSNIK